MQVFIYFFELVSEIVSGNHFHCKLKKKENGQLRVLHQINCLGTQMANLKAHRMKIVVQEEFIMCFISSNLLIKKHTYCCLFIYSITKNCIHP